MIYLTGSTSDRDEPGLIAAGVGLIITPSNSYHLRVDRYPYWAADNGCFNDRWEEDRWLNWLAALPRERCLFAVSPDVYPDAQASIDRLEQWAPVIHELGFPVALVAQDGAEDLDIPWDDLEAIFIGGERNEARPQDEWKLGPGAGQVVAEARRRGKWAHMGRVNSPSRLLSARLMGCHSVDGTYLKYRRRRRVRDPHPDARDERGASELALWHEDQDALLTFSGPGEAPALAVHRDALERRSRG